MSESASGPALLAEAVPLSPSSLRLLASGIKTLWARLIDDNPAADQSPLLLSYDIHPGPNGPVLIEINTNAGGILTAQAAAEQVNRCCAQWEQRYLSAQLLDLFQRDLLGPDPAHCGLVAIVDDELDQQPLRGEMDKLAELMRPHAGAIRVLDASRMHYRNGRLRDGEDAIDRIYWRSTDFLLQDPAHADIARAVAEGSTQLAPSPQAYAAIADKRRFVELSKQPLLAADEGLEFRIAETLAMDSQSIEQWYARRRDWVFKPASGYASRGVYVGKSISRSKLQSLPAADYLAQRYAPHPRVERDGEHWKYDIRLFADRDRILGIAARVFRGQVVGLRQPGSGFAPVHIGTSCCLVGAIWQAQGRAPAPLATGS